MATKIYGSLTDVEQIKEFNDIPVITADAKQNNLNMQDWLYVKGRLATANEKNSNGDFFEEIELRASCDSWIQTQVDYNHDQDMIMGKIIDSVFVEADKANNKNAYINIICKINRNIFPTITAQIECGLLNKFSLECYADECCCSICDHVFNFDTIQPCEHISGGLNRKVKCADGVEREVFKKDRKLHGSGVGIVPHPADHRADLDTVLASEKDKEIKELEMGNIYTVEQLEKLGIKVGNEKEDYFCKTKSGTDYYFQKRKDGKYKYDGSGVKIKSEESKESNDLESALKKLNAWEFLNIKNAIDNKNNGNTQKIAKEIMAKVDILTEKEFYDILAKDYNKLSTIEIEDIKKELKASKKLLGQEYNAYLFASDGKVEWVIEKLGRPILRKSIEEIYGSDLKNDKVEVEIEGMKLRDYAVSDEFKKRLIYMIQSNGIEYMKETWGNKIKGKNGFPKFFVIKENNSFNVIREEENGQKETTYTTEDYDRAMESARDDAADYNGTFVGEVEAGNKESIEAIDELTKIKLLAKELGITLTTEEIIIKMANTSNTIKASETLYVKDRFCKCVEENMGNEDIKLKGKQSRTDATESFCYNKIIGSQIVASERETNIYKLLWKILGSDYDKCVIKGNEKGCSYLQLKATNKLDKMSKKVLASVFNIERSQIKSCQ
jgi:hypothetical protein